jgi:hypothetical protein
MSWYKKNKLKQSSQFPKSPDSDIKEEANKLIKWLEQNLTNRFSNKNLDSYYSIENGEIENPYTQEIANLEYKIAQRGDGKFADCLIQPMSFKDKSYTATLTFYIENMMERITLINELEFNGKNIKRAMRTFLKENIIHEIFHSIDPKLVEISRKIGSSGNLDEAVELTNKQKQENKEWEEMTHEITAELKTLFLIQGSDINNIVKKDQNYVEKLTKVKEELLTVIERMKVFNFDFNDLKNIQSRFNYIKKYVEPLNKPNTIKIFRKMIMNCMREINKIIFQLNAYI